MDLEKIFIKNCSPTKCGGQAVLEGVMMRGADREAITVRTPDGRMHIKITPLPPKKKWAKIPIVRGVAAFLVSLISGTKTLLYSADILEAYESDHPEPGQKPEEEKESKFNAWFTKTFGEKAAWNLMLYSSVVLSLAISIVVFMLGPTVVVNWLSKVTQSVFLLNLAEGLFRLLVFLAYLLAISKMEDIRRLFQYHGAEHKTIHCYENGLELTPQNAQKFGTLHPRCGTSFLCFVIIISVLVHAFLGWPTLWLRVLTRLLCLPVIAGLSYEVLQWAGRSTSPVVKYLSVPGLLAQKLTTREPDDSMVECAIASLRAVTDASMPLTFEGTIDTAGNLTENGAAMDSAEKEPEQ